MRRLAGTPSRARAGSAPVAGARPAPPDEPPRPPRGLIRHVRLAAVVAAVLVVAAIIVVVVKVGTESSSTATSPAASTPANPYLTQRTATAQATLADLAGALRRGDRRAVEELVDPAATPPFRNQLQQWAANLGAIPLARFDFSIGSEPGDGAGLGEGQVPDRLSSQLLAQGSSDAWVAPVSLNYAFGGVADPPVVQSMPLVLARYGDAWKVVGNATAAGQTAPPATPWDFGQLVARVVPAADAQAMILSHPATASLADRLAAAIGAARQAVTGFWGAPPAPLVLIAAASADEFAALVGAGSGDPQTAAAASVYASIQPAAGQRVVFTPTASAMTDAQLQVVLRHELTHIAARSITAVGSPIWITEGMAEYVGRMGISGPLADQAPTLSARVKAGDAPTDLPADVDFGGDRARLAYETAWSVSRYVAIRYGDGQLRALYRALTGATGSDPAVPGAKDAAAQDVAITTALGVNRARLIADWRAWLATA